MYDETHTAYFHSTTVEKTLSPVSHPTNSTVQALHESLRDSLGEAVTTMSVYVLIGFSIFAIKSRDKAGSIL